MATERADAVSPGDVSDILFTSGTTGRSKGAMTAHRQSLAVARAWAECGCLSGADRYLVVNPFFHSFGFKAGILACLVSGAALVPQLVYDAGRAMALVEAERITVFPGPPTIYQTILDHPDRGAHDLSSLRLAVTGAATVPVALVERMRRELSFQSVLTAYGLTEAVVATMCRPGDDPQTVAHTSGRATASFERVRPHGRQPDPRPGQLVAEHRVGGRAGPPGLLNQTAELTLEPDLLAEGGHTPLEGQRAHGDPPAVAGRADHQVAPGAGAVEEHLVELGRAGELPDRADGDPALAHGNEQIGQALAAPRPGLGAGEQEAPVGHVGERGPYLLPGDHPLVAVEGRGGGHGGQVRPGARLGVALAPELIDRLDRGQEPALLFRRAERDQRRPEQLLAQVADPAGRAAAGVLLVEDDLLRQRGPAAAVLGRPAQARPAGGRQVPVPGQPLFVRLMLAAGTARPPQRGEPAGEALRQPPPQPVAELLVLRAQLHPPSLRPDPRARGGRRARGSTVSGQRLSPRVGSAYQAFACYREPRWN